MNTYNDNAHHDSRSSERANEANSENPIAGIAQKDLAHTTADHIHLASARVANQALARGWARTIPWPTEVLGAYGANESTDEDLDDYVRDLTGVAPGNPVPLGDGNPLGCLSACAGRTRNGQPVIRLSLHQAL